MKCEQFEQRFHEVLDARERPSLDFELLSHAEDCLHCSHILLAWEEVVATHWPALPTGPASPTDFALPTGRALPTGPDLSSGVQENEARLSHLPRPTPPAATGAGSAETVNATDLTRAGESAGRSTPQQPHASPSLPLDFAARVVSEAQAPAHAAMPVVPAHGNRQARAMVASGTHKNASGSALARLHERQIVWRGSRIFSGSAMLAASFAAMLLLTLLPLAMVLWPAADRPIASTQSGERAQARAAEPGASASLRETEDYLAGVDAARAPAVAAVQPGPAEEVYGPPGLTAGSSLVWAVTLFHSLPVDHLGEMDLRDPSTVEELSDSVQRVLRMLRFPLPPLRFPPISHPSTHPLRHQTVSCLALC